MGHFSLSNTKKRSSPAFSGKKSVLLACRMYILLVSLKDPKFRYISLLS
jgi:hypothetical protein